ncbi:MAG: hypothetical protein DYG83_00945 [Candidatus Brocadia sp. AMX2]|uniref:hypothetical protein n=1 Tax=Candidatus Brocadia sp. AMX2 TaxID=2293635 RepID=UPI000EDDA6B0|nr:hypothetical protein [Candidatus Brocadia sp. AMX2]MBC6930715.1 hypothetical protein [Candidatus Brocadia sp.]KAA0245642.1 MAG: hypothetical protein EDM70_01795 [Candidatus Brocadia sp. AMX2]MCE7865390.1 hypothetical protein [Candidatus Brocadia sp. AMX2]MCQ3915924.1 hypothetical protein [Candidatus Brocadia sp.]MDL1934003.1 hypothetical protein [Candidatus Brocadia sp. AMX2]
MEKIRVIISRYFIWFAVNFVLCLLPIGISGIISNTYGDDIFLSYLAFSYTLIISSAYVFNSNDNDNRNGVLFWLGIIFAILILCFFILFPKLLRPELLNFLKDNIWHSSGIILIITILISLFLNKPSIDDQINKILAKKNFNQPKETGKRVYGMMDELKKEK